MNIDFSKNKALIKGKILVQIKIERTPSPYKFSSFLKYFKQYFTSEYEIFYAA